MSKELSIIVPVYNVEKYLDKCLNSLANQTIDNYEVIVVNDGTKDNSQLIIDWYVKEYPHIFVSIIKENGGLSDARNYGLKHASGTYLTFLDSDDCVDLNYYEEMLKKLKGEELDLVVSDIKYVWENNEKDPFVKEGLNHLVKDNNKALFLSPLSVCNKVFKKELFDKLNLTFYKGLWYEDIPVALMYGASCGKIGRVNNVNYYYLQRSTSILGSGYTPKMYDIFTIFEKVTDFFKKNNLYDKYYDELEYLYVEHFLLYGAFRFLRTNHYKELMLKAFDFVNKEFPKHSANKYIKTLGLKNELFLMTDCKFTLPFWHWYLTRNYRLNNVYDSMAFSSSLTEAIHYEKEYEKDLSIILPVYNVEKYLDKCLNSLANQTMKNYEVIVVNDGTKDNSQTIIDEYVKNYPSIFKSYIKENGGLSDARNFGLKYASGKYISFLDSDDYVEPNYYVGMYELAEKNQLDLVVADLEYTWEFADKPDLFKEGLTVLDEEINRMLFLSPLFAWNKMYRHELFEKYDLKYPVGLWYEDIPVTLKVFSTVKNVGYYHHLGVHYLQRGTSILGSGYSPKMYDIFTIFENVVQQFKEEGKFETYKKELEYLYVEHFLVYGAFRFLRTDHYKELMGKAFKFVKKEFPDYRRNKYISTFGIKNRIFLYTNNKFTVTFWHHYLTK